MAIREFQGNVLNFRMPLSGINLFKSIVDLNEDECIIAQNLIYLNGLVGRGGRSKFISTQIDGTNKIQSLEVFYDSSGDSIILGASNGIIKKKSGSAWDFIDGSIGTSGFHSGGFYHGEIYHTSIGQSWSLTELIQMNQWGALDSIYIANGNDRAIRFKAGVAVEAGISKITIVDYSIIDNIDTVTVKIDGVSTILTAGGTNWTASVDNNTTAISLASALNGIDGLTATASSAIVSIICDLTVHLQNIATSMESSEATIDETAFLGPPKAVQFLEYQDRLIALDKNNPSSVIWSKARDDNSWETRSSVGIDIDSRLYGMRIHSIHNKNTGYQAGVVFLGASDIYFFQASNMKTPFTTGDYTVYPIALGIGVDAVKTFKWTPVGSMFLARNKKIYLLPFQTSTPVEVSQKITSNLNYISGLEKISSDRISDACGVYHNNYYIISFSRDSTTENDTQFYLEVSRLSIDNKNSYQPWYGPMTGNGASVFSVKKGPGDKGELLSGSGSTGYVYLDADLSILNDDGSAIVHGFQTIFKGGEEGLLVKSSISTLLKRSDRIEVDMLNTITEAIIEFYDLNIQLSILNTFETIGTGGFYCGGFYCGETYHTSNQPSKNNIRIDPLIEFNLLSIVISHKILNEKFELYSLNQFITQEDLVVQESNVL